METLNCRLLNCCGFVAESTCSAGKMCGHAVPFVPPLPELLALLGSEDFQDPVVPASTDLGDALLPLLWGQALIPPDALDLLHRLTADGCHALPLRLAEPHPRNGPAHASRRGNHPGTPAVARDPAPLLVGLCELLPLRRGQYVQDTLVAPLLGFRDPLGPLPRAQIRVSPDGLDLLLRLPSDGSHTLPLLRTELHPRNGAAHLRTSRPSPLHARLAAPTHAPLGIR